jgi:hypothetical protein
MILSERVPNRVPLAGMAAVTLLAMAALPAWTIGQDDVPAPEAPPAAATAPAPAPSPSPQPAVAAVPGVAPSAPQAPLIPRPAIAPRRAAPVLIVTPPLVAEAQYAPAPPAIAAQAAPAAVPAQAPPPARTAKHLYEPFAAQGGDAQDRLKQLQEHVEQRRTVAAHSCGCRPRSLRCQRQ